MIRCHADHHVHFYLTDLFTIYYVKPVVLTDYSLDLVAALVCGVSFVPSTLSDSTYPSILCYLVSRKIGFERGSVSDWPRAATRVARSCKMKAPRARRASAKGFQTGVWLKCHWWAWRKIGHFLSVAHETTIAARHARQPG